ncbi:MAG: hypothetical protein B7733_08125 [Myxococcales bacterium FL481]|nr:MAG: hypothetical protein B7733_08125 [Myxococcales bacterium FL481]
MAGQAAGHARVVGDLVLTHAAFAGLYLVNRTDQTIAAVVVRPTKLAELGLTAPREQEQGGSDDAVTSQFAIAL